MLPGPPGPLLAIIVLCPAHLGRMESGGIGLDQMDKMKTMTNEIMEDIGATQPNSRRVAALLRACLAVVPRGPAAGLSQVWQLAPKAHMDELN